MGLQKNANKIIKKNSSLGGIEIHIFTIWI